MRQITLEILRHGPAHNQLLSPLSQYLALCENHAAVTLQLPFEHNQFLHRLRALSYQLGTESRDFQIRDTSQVLGALLGNVPGLIAELNREPAATGRQPAFSSRRPEERFTHLRIISSASELALLPFELALTPNGFPGAGQSLLLQSQEPICLTREVRRVADDYPNWGKDPRVLFVSAAPSDVPPIPFEAHLSALKGILDPWVRYSDNTQDRDARLEEHLVVLQNATCEGIERACATGQFTHVHILAHGMQYADGFDFRFGLALHDSQDPMGKADIVSAERLATMLRPAQHPGFGGLACPMVVSLVSCESSALGSVAGIGASLAHALHSAGVPIVVASQFPLSIAGSILLTNILYAGLLWGEDPRIALHDLRRQLHSRFPQYHDWASVTAYVSLPRDLERRYSELQISQTMRSMEVAMNYADRATAKFISRESYRQTEMLTDEQKATVLKDARSRIETGRKRLEHLVERVKGEKGRVLGLLAATEKRCAEVYFYFSRKGQAPAETLAWPKLLEHAHRHYWQAFLQDRHNSWAVVQYISLDLMFRRWKQTLQRIHTHPSEEYKQPEALWPVAFLLSSNDLQSQDEQRLRWAYANIIELCLLAQLFESPPHPYTKEKLTDIAKQRAKDLVDSAGQEAFEIYSTRRQLVRYVDWYQEIADTQPMAADVEQVLAILPTSEKHERE